MIQTKILAPAANRTQRYRSILGLGLPIAAGMVSQSILSLVDISMVAALDDTSALAAVGIGSYSAFLAVSLTLGLSIGVQAMVARRIGEDRAEAAIEPLNAGLLLALVAGLLLTVTFLYAADPLIALLNTNTEVRTIASDYLYYRVLGITAVAVNFAYRGFWNGIQKPMTYLAILLLVHLCNFGFSYCLIFGAAGFPEMGAVGSGLGTTISLFIGSVLLTAASWLGNRQRRFLQQWPSSRVMATILRLAIPNSSQYLLVALGTCVLYALLGRIGVSALAAGHTIINITLFIVLPGTGLALAATTLVADALGRNAPREAYQWGWDTVQVSAPILAGLGLPLLLFPEAILTLFLPDDPQLLAMARTPLQITGAASVLQAFTLVLPQALLGAGANRTVLAVSATSQWLLGLPLAAFIGIYLGYGLTGVWSAQVIERLVTAGVYCWLWSRQQWVNNQF